MYTVALLGISEKVSYPLEELGQSHICEKLGREVFAVCGQSYPVGNRDRAVLAKTRKRLLLSWTKKPSLLMSSL